MDFENNLLVKRNRGSAVYGIVLNVVLALVILALLAVLIVTSTFSLCQVLGTSMAPGLEDKQYVMVEKQKAEIKNNDVIVFNKDGTQYIKRAVAVAGDKVRFERTDEIVIVNNSMTRYQDERQHVVELYVNDAKLDETYLGEKMGDGYWNNSGVIFKLGQEYTVGEGLIFALGDNRNISKDSRMIGCVTRDELMGRVDFELESGSFAEWLIKLFYGVYFRPQTGSAGQV